MEENKEQKSLEELLMANLAKSEEILTLVRETRSFVRWSQVWGFLRLIIIIIPIILGFIYLPPLLKDAIETYRHLLP